MVPSGTGFSDASSVVPSGTGFSDASSVVPSGTGFSDASSVVPSGTGFSDASSVVVGSCAGHFCFQRPPLASFGEKPAECVSLVCQYSSLS